MTRSAGGADVCWALAHAPKARIPVAVRQRAGRRPGDRERKMCIKSPPETGADSAYEWSWQEDGEKVQAQANHSKSNACRNPIAFRPVCLGLASREDRIGDACRLDRRPHGMHAHDG